MPYDQAIYANSPLCGGSFIFAVRGGQVYRIDPATGSRVASGFFDRTVFTPACIAYNPVLDRLYCGGFNASWNPVTQDYLGPFAFGTSSPVLYTVNPSTLALQSAVDIGVLVFTPHFYNGNTGILTMIWAGAGPQEGLYLKIEAGGATYAARYIVGSPFVATRDGGDKTDSQTQLSWDSVNSLMYSTRPWNEQLAGLAMAQDFVTPSSWSGLHFPQSSIFNTWNNGGATASFGVAWCPNTGDVYYSSQLGTVVRCNFDGTNLIFSTSINSGVSGICFRLRYNPNDGLLYYPVPSADKIVIIDPTTNLVVDTKTGFDSPYDTVFTPTKKWAVQLGNIGLKEILP